MTMDAIIRLQVLLAVNDGIKSQCYNADQNENISECNQKSEIFLNQFV